MQENFSNTRSKYNFEPTKIERLAAGGKTTCSSLIPEKTIVSSGFPAVSNSRVTLNVSKY
jgi:hypothetical protein